MSSRTFSTLDPNRLDSALVLSQGNLVVTTNAIATISRKVLGTIAHAAGQIAFECYFWSTTRPSGGLVNLCSVGVASVGSPLNVYTGGDTVTATVDSCGLRTSDGAGNAGIYRGAAVTTALQQINERTCIGVLLDNTVSPPIVSFHADGTYLGQKALTAGLFYVPSISVGSLVAADVNAYCNFGQHALDNPLMQVNK